jgi:predicted phage tail protein
MVGTSFCPECGAPTTPLAETCSSCGGRLKEAIQVRTWKTRAAGILAIVAGAVAVVESVFVAALVIRALGWLEVFSALDESGIVAAAVAVVVISAIVAIVGGVFALKRRIWGLAIAGSICAIFSFIAIPFLLNLPLAIAAIVLVVLGRGEFE